MAEKNILWQVGCEGHRPAWVIAPNWEQATVKAAEFWGVPWGSVAAGCEPLRKTVAHTNICCVCGRVYHGAPPMCEACRLTEETEEMRDAERRRHSYVKENQDYERLGLKGETV